MTYIFWTNIESISIKAAIFDKDIMLKKEWFSRIIFSLPPLWNGIDIMDAYRPGAKNLLRTTITITTNKTIKFHPALTNNNKHWPAKNKRNTNRRKPKHTKQNTNNQKHHNKTGKQPNNNHIRRRRNIQPNKHNNKCKTRIHRPIQHHQLQIPKQYYGKHNFKYRRKRNNNNKQQDIPSNNKQQWHNHNRRTTTTRKIHRNTKIQQPNQRNNIRSIQNKNTNNSTKPNNNKHWPTKNKLVSNKYK